MHRLQYIPLLILLLSLFDNTSSQTPFIEISASKNIDITITLLNTDAANLLKLHCGSYASDIRVVITNRTDTAASFYEDWNQWGYLNMKFQIITRDSVYEIYRKPRGWNKNFPSYITLYPKDSLVLVYNFREQDCPYSEFEGLPQVNLACAKFRAVYQLNLAWHQSILEFRPIDWFQDRKGTKTPTEIFRSFPVTKLISKDYEITFVANQKETSDL